MPVFFGSCTFVRSGVKYFHACSFSVKPEMSLISGLFRPSGKVSQREFKSFPGNLQGTWPTAHEIGEFSFTDQHGPVWCDDTMLRILGEEDVQRTDWVSNVH